MSQTDEIIGIMLLFAGVLSFFGLALSLPLNFNFLTIVLTITGVFSIGTGFISLIIAECEQ